MSARRRLLALATTGALLVALSALTRVPWATGAGDASLLRLSWRARGEIVERCRRASAEELARTAAHMRQDVICEGRRVAPYVLHVSVDGRTLVDGPVDGSGAAGDGSLYVLHDLPLAPGPHRVQVRFARAPGAVPDDDADDDNGDDEDGDEEHGDDAREAGARREGRRHTIPPLLVLDTTIAVVAGRVALVTYEAEAERLVVLGDAADGPGQP